METNVSSQSNSNNQNAKTGKVVAAIGRWMPLHNGHKAFLVSLAKSSEFDKIVIMIGSCYEGGSSRYCITTTEREKMIRLIMEREAVPEDRYDIVPVPDVPTFEEWISNVLEVCKTYNVTHFCTGNKEDILNELEKRDEPLNLELINPEEGSDFPYHATDIRNMIIAGEYEKLKKLIPEEIKPILFKYSFKEILAASGDRGINFIEGRQTVDMVLLVKNIKDGKTYVLLGNRPKDKKDFPGMLALPGGAINIFETPTKAAIRKFYDETGIKIKMLDNSLEPAIIKFEDIPFSLEQLTMVGIYGTEDESLNGTKGGSSQCFAILVEGNLEDYQKLINPYRGLTNVKFYDVEKISKKPLAYQHRDMLKKSIKIFESYPYIVKEIKRIKERNTLVFYMIGGPGTGKSTAALGVAYMLKLMGKSVEYVDEFAKGLQYNDLLQKYIPNQSYIIAEQYKKIYDLLGKVDYIISDAGLEISALHSIGDKTSEALAWHLSNQVDHITILIERDVEKVKYEELGRDESEEESNEFSEKLEEYLKKNNAQYVKVIGSDAAIEYALKTIEEREKNNADAE